MPAVLSSAFRGFAPKPTGFLPLDSTGIISPQILWNFHFAYAAGRTDHCMEFREWFWTYLGFRCSKKVEKHCCTHISSDESNLVCIVGIWITEMLLLLPNSVSCFTLSCCVQDVSTVSMLCIPRTVISDDRFPVTLCNCATVVCNFQVLCSAAISCALHGLVSDVL